MSANNCFGEILQHFGSVTTKPENFLSVQENLYEPVKQLTKTIYDLTKNDETRLSSSNALPELIIKDFDAEQIWQELELQNEDRWTYSLSNISKILTSKTNLEIPIHFDDEDNESNDAFSTDNLINTEILEKVKKSKPLKTTSVKKSANTKPKSKKKDKGSVVDDKFFKLCELEAYLDAEDKSEMMKEKKRKKKNESSDDEDEDDDIDLFDDWDSEEDNDAEDNPINVKYSDFFDSKSDSETDDINPNAERKSDEKEAEEESIDEFENNSDIDLHDNDEMKKVRFDLPQPSSSEDDDDDVDDIDMEGDNIDAEKNNESSKNIEENLSEYQLRQQRLNKKISHLENSLLEGKTWMMKGEVDASIRPQNSLLEQIVDFDMTSRPAPVITEETTVKLQDIIIQRIKDKAWDDVERKAKPVKEVNEFKKQLVLDQEKSKLSLAQVYEKEYIKQREALDPDADEKPEEEPKEHIEIRSLMTSLFSKLDALSHFHYTPKIAVPEVKIISNMPAILMEEVTPVATSDATLLAPEEIKAKNKGDIIGKSERTDTDKKRERRQKKLQQREKEKEKQKREKLIEKVRPGLGNKYSKQKMNKLLDSVTKDRNVNKMEELADKKSFTSSTAFFTQLQDEVSNSIHSKLKKNPNKQKKIFSAKQLKL
ncbi:U3 small nucleolar ribonucleoprotein MPP10-like [Arctopsyche grandis]|uniref:U3 small nucleolar ribonucleoprotein MPP10-like n=1 Tax=Arctopsyche grandis TaxID=121162 RepID=UPI00406D921F